MRYTNEFRKKVPGKLCVYCGDNATSAEHFPPASHGYEGWILPCCLECNSLAGTAYSYNFSKRCEYVKEKLKIKYPKASLNFDVPYLISIQDEEEWNETVKRLNQERLKSKRLAWCAETYLQHIGVPSLIVVKNVEINSITKKELKRTETAKCSYCGAEYRLKHKKRLYCTDTCQNSMNTIRLKIRQGVIFKSPGPAPNQEVRK